MTQEQRDTLIAFYSNKTTKEIQPNFEDIKITADNMQSIIAVATAIIGNVFQTVNDNISSINTNASQIDNINVLAGMNNVLSSLVTDKATLDSIFADKATLDGLFAIKSKIDSLFTDKLKLDSIYADKSKLDSIYLNLSKIQTVVTNIIDIQSAEDNANLAIQKAQEASSSADLALQYKNEAQQIAGGEILSTNVKFSDLLDLETYRTNTDNAISSINTLLTSNDTTLDQLQELVDFIKANKATLDTLGIANIAGLQSALDSKTTELNTHKNNTSNPHAVTKEQVGLGNVENKSITAEIATIPKTLANSMSNVMLSGGLAIAQTTITKGMLTHLYNGNSTGTETQDLVTGVGSVDANSKTQMESFSYPIYLSRTAGTFPIMYHSAFGSGTEDVALSEAEWEQGGEFALSNNGFIVNVHIKSLNSNLNNNIYDGLRGSKVIYADLSNSEEIPPNTVRYTNNGISITGSHNQTNGIGITYALHKEIYTQFKYGKTNGVKWIYCYNPITMTGIGISEGSNNVFAQPMPFKVDYLVRKRLNSTNAGYVFYGDKDNSLELYSAGGGNNAKFSTNAWNNTEPTDDSFTFNGDVAGTNQSGGVYFFEFFANSDYKKLINYRGTGISGLKITTPFTPSRYIAKAIGNTGRNLIGDVKRGNDLQVDLAGSEAETSFNYDVDIVQNGVEINTTSTNLNRKNTEYYMILERDTNGTGDDTYFNNPTDDTKLNVINGKLVFPKGRLPNGGYNIETADFTGSLDFVGVGDGTKYVGVEQGTNNVVAYDKVSVGLYDKLSADDNRLVIDAESCKQYTTVGGELVTNGRDLITTTGWTADASNLLSVINGNLNVDRNGSSSIGAKQSIPTEVGEEYVLGIFATGYKEGGTAWLKIGTTDGGEDIESDFSTMTTEGHYIFIFTAITTQTHLGLGVTNNINGQVEYNASMFKKRATLGTPLTNPVCFINKFPYQVASQTPQIERDDLPAIPLNVMEEIVINGEFLTDNIVQTWFDVPASQSITANVRTNIVGLKAKTQPRSSNSRFRIKVRWTGEPASLTNENMIFGIRRNGLDVGNPKSSGNRGVGIDGVSQGYWNSDSGSTPDRASYEYIDSPNTLDEITYTATLFDPQSFTLYTNRTASDSNNAGYERLTSSIIVEEIGAEK